MSDGRSTPDRPVPWTPALDGARLRVRLTPRGGRDAIDGVAVLSDGTPVMLARVAAVADKGAANRALAALVAEAADVPASAVSIVAGATARLKTLAIGGEPARIAAALEAASRGERLRRR